MPIIIRHALSHVHSYMSCTSSYFMHYVMYIVLCHAHHLTSCTNSCTSFCVTQIVLRHTHRPTSHTSSYFMHIVLCHAHRPMFMHTVLRHSELRLFVLLTLVPHLHSPPTPLISSLSYSASLPERVDAAPSPLPPALRHTPN